MAYTIYVVVGESGDNDDYYSWMVKGFKSRAKADSHAAQCGTEFEKLCEQYRKIRQEFDDMREKLPWNFNPLGCRDQIAEAWNVASKRVSELCSESDPYLPPFSIPHSVDYKVYELIVEEDDE